MALIGLRDKRCVVGRAGHSAKTKARRGREIDVLIFPFEGQAAGYSAPRRGHGGKKCAHFCSPSGGWFCSRRKALRGPQPRGLRGPPRWSCWQRGGSCVKEGGYYCYKFHHFHPQMWKNGRRSAEGGGRRGSRRLLFQSQGVISARILSGNSLTPGRTHAHTKNKNKKPAVMLGTNEPGGRKHRFKEVEFCGHRVRGALCQQVPFSRTDGESKEMKPASKMSIK